MDAVLIHLFQLLKRRSELPDHVLLLQATSPLRVDADIEKAIELYSKGEFELLISVTDAEPSILKYGTISEGNLPRFQNQNIASQIDKVCQSLSPERGYLFIFD